MDYIINVFIPSKLWLVLSREERQLCFAVLLLARLRISKCKGVGGVVTQVEGILDERWQRENPVQVGPSLRFADVAPGGGSQAWAAFVAEEAWYSANKQDHPLGAFLIASQIPDDTCQLACIPYHVLDDVFGRPEDVASPQTWRSLLQKYRCAAASAPREPEIPLQQPLFVGEACGS